MVIIKSSILTQEKEYILEKMSFLLNDLVSFFTSHVFSEEIREDWAGRYGGGLCVFGEQQFQIDLWATVGIVPHEKENKYIFFSREKGERLFLHLAEGHTTSYESQNIEKKEFGGAVFVKKNNKRYSFSGLPEVRDKGDSILMLSLAVVLNELNIESAFEISKYILKTDNFENFYKFLNNKHPYFFSS